MIAKQAIGSSEDASPILRIRASGNRMAEMSLSASEVSSLTKSIGALMEEMVASGRERGMQVAAYHQGRLLFNLSAGQADRARPVGPETMFPVYSVSKGIAATAIHILAERGLLTYDRPVGEVWPEFAANGKEKITLRQVLCHSAGVPQMPTGITLADLVDWETMCARIAELPPLYPPGTRMMYHAITWGWIVGEVARRVDGRDFGRIIQEEICAPLGIDDLFIGMPAELEERVAVVEENPADFTWPPPPPPGTPEAIPLWLCPLDQLMNRPEAHQACIPATSGIMSAHALARHYAGLLPGGVDGVELLPPSRIREATRPQRPEYPEGDYPLSNALGYTVGAPDKPVYGRVEAFGHGGHGGSMGFADPVLGLAVGIVKNSLNKQPVAQQIADAIRQAVSGAA